MDQMGPNLKASVNGKINGFFVRFTFRPSPCFRGFFLFLLFHWIISP